MDKRSIHENIRVPARRAKQEKKKKQGIGNKKTLGGNRSNLLIRAIMSLTLHADRSLRFLPESGFANLRPQGKSHAAIRRFHLGFLHGDSSWERSSGRDPCRVSVSQAAGPQRTKIYENI